MTSSKEPPIPSHSPLATLPQEIKDHIVTFLDPIGYVSLSQTAHIFRRAQPLGHWHMVQRLLQLELDPAHGIYTPRLEGPSQHPTPTLALRNPWWGDARYACPGCMRLRHHRWFRSQMITPIPLRKPGRTSRAANALLEPHDLRDRWALRRRVSAAQGDARLMLWGRHHIVCKYVKNTFDRPQSVSGWPKPRMQPYPNSNLRGSVWMDELCGLGRHERRCMACEARSLGRFDVHMPVEECRSALDWYDSTSSGRGRGLLVAPRRMFEDTFMLSVPQVGPAGHRRRAAQAKFMMHTNGTDRLYGGIDTSNLPASLLCGFCERLYLLSDELVAPGEVMDPVASSIKGHECYDGTWQCGCLDGARSGASYRPSTPTRVAGPYHRNTRLQWHRELRDDSSDYILMHPQDFYKRDIPPSANPLLHQGGRFREEAMKLPIMRDWQWAT